MNHRVESATVRNRGLPFVVILVGTVAAKAGGVVQIENSQHEQSEPAPTWGPKLFAATLVAALVFFWWLLIYSHGVAPHPG